MNVSGEMLSAEGLPGEGHLCTLRGSSGRGVGAAYEAQGVDRLRTF